MEEHIFTTSVQLWHSGLKTTWPKRNQIPQYLNGNWYEPVEEKGVTDQKKMIASCDVFASF